MGISAVPVRRKPRAALISTGDELVQVGQPLSLDQIRDVNAPSDCPPPSTPHRRRMHISSASLKTYQSAIARRVAIAHQGLRSAAAFRGTSVGVKDAHHSVVSELGELLVHGVAAQTRQANHFWHHENKPVFGLPGNPVAAYFNVLRAGTPLLYSMLETEPESGPSPCRSPVRFPPTTGVRNSYGDGASLRRAAHRQQVPGLITTLSSAHGFHPYRTRLRGLRRVNPWKCSFSRGEAMPFQY
jgi:molybdopterin biosynthesis enzyme